MLARVALLTCLLSMLPNFTWADSLVSKNPTEKTKIKHSSKNTEINTNQKDKSEAEILESLDNLNQQGNNEIFLVESQNSLIENSQKVKINGKNKTSNDAVNDEEPLLDDGFDELDLGEMFTDLESDVLNKVIQKEKSKGSTKKDKAEEKYGVGVVGDEAVLINTLDHSNLMDFENEIDIWSKKKVENKKNNKTKSSNN